MDSIKKLEIKRLFKELEYVESDYEYRSEIINNADNDFISEINSLLEKNPELKELYDNKVNVSLPNIDNSIYDIDLDDVEDDVKVRVEYSPKIKKLYREIVKMTHPDKNVNQNFNKTYIRATEYYDMNDKIGIYKICSELNIEYDIDVDENLEIEKKINDIKNRIKFLESTFTYQWMKIEDVNAKNELLLKFIENKLK